MFLYNSGNTSYIVSYRNAGNGVIAYDYTSYTQLPDVNFQIHPEVDAVVVTGIIVIVVFGSLLFL